MKKIYCKYDETEIADHQCDICLAPLCSVCGFQKDGVDYCNECWIKEQPEIEYEKALDEVELKRLIKERGIEWVRNRLDIASIQLKDEDYEKRAEAEESPASILEDFNEAYDRFREGIKRLIEMIEKMKREPIKVDDNYDGPDTSETLTAGYNQALQDIINQLK